MNRKAGALVVASVLGMASVGLAKEHKKVSAACTIVGDTATKVFYNAGEAEYTKLKSEAHKPGNKAQCFATVNEAETAGYHHSESMKK